MTSNIFQIGFGGEPIVSQDGKSLEGVGETRLTTGTMYTDKLFTGQRDTGLGIYDYDAALSVPLSPRIIRGPLLSNQRPLANDAINQP